MKHLFPEEREKEREDEFEFDDDKNDDREDEDDEMSKESPSRVAISSCLFLNALSFSSLSQFELPSVSLSTIRPLSTFIFIFSLKLFNLRPFFTVQL